MNQTKWQRQKERIQKCIPKDGSVPWPEFDRKNANKKLIEWK